MKKGISNPKTVTIKKEAIKEINTLVKAFNKANEGVEITEKTLFILETNIRGILNANGKNSKFFIAPSTGSLVVRTESTAYEWKIGK